MNSSSVGACPRRRPSPMPRRAAGRNAAAWGHTERGRHFPSKLWQLSIYQAGVALPQDRMRS